MNMKIQINNYNNLFNLKNKQLINKLKLLM